MDYLKTGNIRPDYDAPGLPKARKALIYDTMPPGEKKYYSDYLDTIRVQQNAINDSRADGRVEGLPIGKDEGKAEGRTLIFQNL